MFDSTCDSPLKPLSVSTCDSPLKPYSVSYLFCGNHKGVICLEEAYINKPDKQDAKDTKAYLKILVSNDAADPNANIFQTFGVNPSAC